MESFAPLLFDHLPRPAELLPAGSWVVLTQARRTRDRAAQALAEADALAEAIGWPGPPALVPLDDALGGRRASDLTGFTEGSTSGSRAGGAAQGNPAELATRLSDLADRGYRSS